jgi:hypothetical protein
LEWATLSGTLPLSVFVIFLILTHLSFNIPIRFKPKWDIALFGEELEKTATYQVKIA